MTSLKTNTKTLIKNLPEKIGVYQYFDNKQNLLYVGKAKNIKKRVGSYFTKNKFNLKTKILISKIYDIKYIVVDSEVDALLLENNLIKTHQPKYNIMLKDGKSYTWICINTDAFPKVFKTRKILKDNSEYYGPYMSVNLVNVLLGVFSDFFYDEGWDPFSFLNKKNDFFPKKKYLQIIEKIRKILKGDSNAIIKYLKNKMERHSCKLEFEKAQTVKEHLNYIKTYQSKSTIVSSKISNVDVFAFVSEKKYSYVNYIKIMRGAIVTAYTIELCKRLDEDDVDVLTFAITNIRERFKSRAKHIYCSQQIPSLWDGVRVIVPKIGDKKRLVELGLKNANVVKLEMGKKRLINKEGFQKNRVLEQLKKDLNLKNKPVHIECFDNSNLQGTNAVSSCVVFKEGVPSKKEYRNFNIKNVVGINDFASIEEVVFRRYKRLLKEKRGLPQLIIIDGGKGQLSSAQKSLVKLDLLNKITCVGIAKKLEEIFFVNDAVPLYLNKRSESLKLIQKIRNESHRFAIAHHRKKRSSNLFKTSLDNITGVGEKSIRLLIARFGSIHKIKTAKKKELEKIVGKNKAERILKYYLHFD